MSPEAVNIRALEKGDIARVAEYLSHPLLAGLTGLAGDRGLTLAADEINEAFEKWRSNAFAAT